MRDVYNIDYHPKILIRDGAHSIQNGFEIAFGEDGIGLMCWAHMRRKVGEILPKYIRNKKKLFELFADLSKLQLSKSHELFDEASALFVAKWKVISADAMNYFEKEWLRKNRYWYEGAASDVCATSDITSNIPSTNNAAETANRLIKDEHTLRELFDLGQFRAVVFDMLKIWSLAYVEGEKEFHDSAEIELKQ